MNRNEEAYVTEEFLEELGEIDPDAIKNSVIALLRGSTLASAVGPVLNLFSERTNAQPSSYQISIITSNIQQKVKQSQLSDEAEMEVLILHDIHSGLDPRSV